MTARVIGGSLWLSAAVWCALGLAYSDGRLLVVMGLCVATALVLDFTATRVHTRNQVWDAVAEATAQAWAEFNALGLKACTARGAELTKIRARQATLLRALGLPLMAEQMERQDAK